MSWKIPCNATEGRFYNGGKGCSKCEICPGGQGRNMSKRVLNTSETFGDLECIKCEVCPPNTYNNGGREGCNKCLDDCAVRNRHDCPEKATQQCGGCLDGYFEDYQIDDDPSTCIQCTEKEKSIIPACANVTTAASSAIDTPPVSSKATNYLNIQNRTTTNDNHVFRENIPVLNKAVESNNENSPTGYGYLYPSLLALGTITTVIVVFLAIWVICRYYKKRRQRHPETDQGNRTEVQGVGPFLVGTSGNSVNSPLLAGTSGNSVNSPLLAAASGNYIDSPILAADADKMAHDDFALENDLETDTKPVPKRMDRNRWIHRQELLKSKISIHQLCAKRWTAVDSEYPVLSMPEEEVQLLKKEAQSKNWTPQELNFQILSRWAQIKGNQATVQSLCDALFSKEQYDIIEEILKENPRKEIKLNL